MLSIRLQRTGRKGHAHFRVVVQESRLTPTSGRVVANLGSLDPHTKEVTLDKEKAAFYLSNGAQPSERVAKMFKRENIELPSWVKIVDNQNRVLRNPEKLRKNQPTEEVVAEAPAEEPVADAPADEPSTEEASVEEKVEA
jgi:small subunit ribosomal protein S16